MRGPFHDGDPVRHVRLQRGRQVDRFQLAARGLHVGRVEEARVGSALAELADDPGDVGLAVADVLRDLLPLRGRQPPQHGFGVRADGNVAAPTAIVVPGFCRSAIEWMSEPAGTASTSLLPANTTGFDQGFAYRAAGSFVLAEANTSGRTPCSICAASGQTPRRVAHPHVVQRAA